MKLFSKLMALCVVATTITQAYGMHRLMRTAQVARPALAASRISGTRLALKTALNKVETRSSRIIAARPPAQQQPRRPFVTAAWRMLTLKRNDPIQLESDVRVAIAQNSVKQLNDVLKNHSELLAGNNNRFVRSASSVPYLIEVGEMTVTKDPKLVSKLILHCPHEINEEFLNPKVQASGDRRLATADHYCVTPISMAVQHHQHDMVVKLLENGAYANTLTSSRTYPTVLAKAAVQNMELETAKALVKHGARVNYYGYDTLALARKMFTPYHGHYEEDILKWLEETYNAQK